MADALVGRVLAEDTTEAGSPRVSLNLVMSDLDLFGTDDEPAHVDGVGSIPAELARELVSDACSRDERVWLRRLFRHPRTGELVAADARTRLFPTPLARFIRLRDRVCRTPWCDAPVRHVDHATSKAADGPTSVANAQGLCEACNYAKQAPGWHARPSPDAVGHEIETMLPTGHSYRTRPPPTTATIRRTPIRLDYILTG
jgi:5-methylcytosine-specific restriction endonuclease McrA